MTQRVFYRELPSREVFGREFFEIVRSDSPFWPEGDTFSDDDMSMGRAQVEFIEIGVDTDVE